MDIEFEVTGNNQNHLESQARSLADRFYGYTEKIKQMNNRKKPPVEEYVPNPEPRPYELIFGTVHIKHRDTYDPMYMVLVSTKYVGN
jgi:hypothetical protein